MMRTPPAADAAHAHQIEGDKAQQGLAREFGLANQLGLGQTPHCLDPAKGLFNALAHLQTGLVTLMALDAAIDCGMLVFGHAACALQG